ncbi:MAG: tripartite tricarboxylate transporter TctB family protein, partial [Desulfobacterales bacterium]|nr:tripartite tricarboxylate transporter TctB family protein [Desulfobacterales bacterium]
VHIWLLNYLGFICSSFIFLMCFFYLFKDRRFQRMAVISSISALSLWFIFEVILKTPLPLGLWADFLH